MSESSRIAISLPVSGMTCASCTAHVEGAWLCSLPLVAVVVISLFGLRVAAVVALALFGIAMAVCWGLCGRKVYQALTRKSEEALNSPDRRM